MIQRYLLVALRIIRSCEITINHRRRRADGRGERRAEIRRRRLVPLRLGLVERRRMDGPCDVPRFDRLLRLAHPAGQKGRITFNLQRQWT